jgi:coproporphyrinogen III oxidase-like Fe-S oxidoreductase
VETLNQAGVNRLSVGVQTFEDDLLKSLGRFTKYGSGDEIKQRLNTYQGVFDTLNIDMIYNFPTQTPNQIANDLDSIRDLNVDQVTYYPLMASKMKHDDIMRELGRMDYRKEKVLYRMIREALADEYEPASAWCYSRKQGMIDEYIVDYPEYAGLGSGAFGFLGASIYANTFSVNAYIQSVRKSRLPLAGMRRFSPKEKALYGLLMDLFGGKISVSKKEKALIWKELTGLRLSGAVRKGEGDWLTTNRGRYYAVILMREFFNGVNNLREQRLQVDK